MAEPRSLLLVDVDGDGCADLVVVDASGVQVWFNQSGNGFAPVVRDPLIPAPIPGTLVPASMSARTAQGLMWCGRRPSSPSGAGYVSYELIPATPPHLLVGVDNGIGLHATIDYSTAADESDRDRDAGTPWRRELPFPLIVVAGTLEVDAVTGQRAESRYDYHDGYFDTRTRTFEGFARVDKREIGDTSRPDSLTVLHFRVGADDVPGADPHADALNRMLVTTELYQLDATPQEVHPYRVEETEHTVEVLDETAAGVARVWVRIDATVKRWTERNGHRAMASNTFGGRMKLLGHNPKKTNSGWRYSLAFLTAADRLVQSDTNDELVTNHPSPN